MKKKNTFRIALVLILFNLIFISFAIKAYSLEFTLDVNENDVFIWKVTDFDEDIYDSIFITEPADFDEDDLTKYKIMEIDKSSDYWKIKYYVWDYTDDVDDFEKSADEEKRYKIYRDPEDQADSILLLEEIIKMWLIPTPYTNYLNDFEEEFSHQVIRVYSDGESLNDKVSATKEIPAAYEIELTYDVNGVMEKLEYFDQNSNNFLEFTLQKEAIIPGYDLFILLGMLSFFGLISIIFLRKKISIKKK
jgi:hypothetical protein